VVRSRSASTASLYEEEDTCVSYEDEIHVVRSRSASAVRPPTPQETTSAHKVWSADEVLSDDKLRSTVLRSGKTTVCATGCRLYYSAALQ